MSTNKHSKDELNNSQDDLNVSSNADNNSSDTLNTNTELSDTSLFGTSELNKNATDVNTDNVNTDNTETEEIHISRKERRARARKERKKHKKRFYKRWWFYILVLPTIAVGGGAGYAWHQYGPTIQSAINDGYTESAKIDKDSLNHIAPTVIYDSQGRSIKRLNSIGDLHVTNDNRNPYLAKGFVSVEDKRFYKNKGVDLYGTLRAVAMHFVMGRPLQGGSTITQQVARNAILHNQQQTVGRKISEMVVAQNLDKEFSKDDILTSYLNNSYFGHGATGVAAAAKYYFGKDQKDLNVREAATIIGLTNNPTLYDPSTNKEVSDDKIATTLGTMYANGVITKAQYKEALHQKTELHITPLINDNDFTKNYAISYAMHNSAEELAKQDGFQFKYKFANTTEYNKYHQAYNQMMQNEIDKIVSGGYNIYTSIDMDVQNKVQNAALSVLAPYTTRDNEGKLMPQVSATILDNNTHNVVAVLGGRGTDNDYFNRAYQSFRQPGSTAKPIVAYTPAFMKGDTPQGMVYDGPVPQYPTVHNAGQFNFRNMSIRTAVVNSLNTPALREAMKTPANELTDNLAKMQFSHLAPEDDNYIISIGGFTNGVSTTEMAGAYSTLTNGGVYTPASNITKITNSTSGDTLYDNDHPKTQVYAPSSSYMMLDVMKSVVNGPTVTAPALTDKYPKKLQAVKTGQTDSDKDTYFVATNYYYANAVWVGNDNGALLSEDQVGLAMKVNKAIQDVTLAGKAPKDFNKPNNVSKNGDIINKIGPEPNLVTENVDDTKSIQEQLEKNKATNKKRIDSMDYRIIYGLSEGQEKEREERVQSLVDEVNSDEFTSISQYGGLQGKLSKATSLLTDVKHAAAKDALRAQIADAQKKVSSQYSYLQLVKEQNTESSNQEILDQARAEAKSKNSSKIKADKDKYNSLISQIESGLKSGSDVDSLKSELETTISQLNSMGEATPTVTFVTDGNGNYTVSYSSKPNLKQTN